MNIEEYRTYCISKDGVTESFPFDERTLVFKVYGKMFALTDVDTFTYVNLKQAPEKSEELRAHYNGIKEGYHMNKKHWNSVYIDEDVPNQLIYQQIEDSYKLVLASIPVKKRTL
jgi:predicted DNA-binding protein (MmcQ/YjbR family)